MATIKEVLVPDIGDFKDIPVIEVLVKAGDRVKEEDSQDKQEIETIKPCKFPTSSLSTAPISRPMLLCLTFPASPFTIDF